MVDKVDWIWSDGEWQRWDDANVHILTHALHYGLGAFEGIRCYAQSGGGGGGGIFRLREHIDRLYASMHMCMFEIPYSRDEIIEACRQVVARNKLASGCYLRPISFLGSGQMGLAADNPVRTSIIAWRWGAYLGDDGIENGIRCRISSYRRPKGDTALPKGKICGQYVTGILAKREALLDGYDEAIMMDTTGLICEGSGENIFVCKDGVVTTPSLDQALLGGITRNSVLHLLRDADYPIREAGISRDDLYIADEVFFTGTAAEVTPVREIDRRTIGTGKPGPITKAMQKRYSAVVRGEDPRSAEWVTPVAD